MECNSNYRILNNQVKIPCAAFGTYKAAEGNSADIIGTAIRADTGILIRLLFTARRNMWQRLLKRAGFQGRNFF